MSIYEKKTPYIHQIPIFSTVCHFTPCLYTNLLLLITIKQLCLLDHKQLCLLDHNQTTGATVPFSKNSLSTEVEPVVSVVLMVSMSHFVL